MSGDKGVWLSDRELWQRWQALGGKGTAREPDSLSIAAYAEGRLSEGEAEAVEAWLAARPEAVDDIVAARVFDRRPPRVTFEHALIRACNLVPGTVPAAQPTATVLSFGRRVAPQLRTALAWSSIAASLVCASLVGFSMGSDAYASLSGTQTVDTASGEGLDTPPSLDSYFSDESGT